MKERLEKIRKSGASPMPASAVHSALFLLLGIVLGIFSKWLDNLALDSAVWWHRPIERLGLGTVFSSFPVWLLIALAIAVFSRNPLKAAVNVFLFFAGMCAATLLGIVLVPGLYVLFQAMREKVRGRPAEQ